MVDPRVLHQRFERSRMAIVGRRLQDLPSTRLSSIVEHLDDESEQVVVEIERLAEQADRALEEHSWSTFDGLRVRAIDATSRYEGLRNARHNVRNMQRERHLEEQIELRLGSRRRAVLYDAMIMVLIVVVVVALMVQLFATMDEKAHIVLDLIDVSACIVFLGDFFWRMRLAESKRWFWKRYWLDFVTSIPIPASLLRAGRIVRFARLARMIRLIRLIRIVRALLFFSRGMDKLAATMDVGLMRRSLKILTTVLVLGGIGIWYVEGSAHVRGVEDVGQGLWWSFTTVVTGGFGDIYNPTSWTGRMLTVALIIVGMVVVGIFTATLTSVLVREEDTTAAVLALDDKLSAELASIREELARRSEDPAVS